MHPAASVIFFTVASGAGYGLLAILGVGVALGVVPGEPWFARAATGLALALVTAGLLASTAHLGRPERAWRALSQWRSSWLSREGVAALATYAPAALFGLGWAWFGMHGPAMAAAGIAAAVGAVATVTMTGMIYASLKPVRQWHGPLTVPVYLALALMSGATLYAALLAGFAAPTGAATGFAAVATLFGWAWKRAYWRRNARGGALVSLNAATGLEGGTVRSIEWPHTAPSYVMKEMAFRVARKHAARLRVICEGLAFAAPAAMLVAAALAPPLPGAILAVLAVPVQIAGLLVERWLFFAEAEHVVAVYFGIGD